MLLLLLLLLTAVMPVICPSALQRYGSNVNKDGNWEERVRMDEEII